MAAILLAAVGCGSLAAAQSTTFGPRYHVVGHAYLDVLPDHTRKVETWTLRRAAETGADITIVAATLPGRQYRASLRSVDQFSSAKKIYTARLCTNALAVTNGNFYVRDGQSTRPLGLLRVSGKTLSAVSRRSTGGFLVIKDGTIDVQPRAEAPGGPDAAEALESTPHIGQGWSGRHAGRRSRTV